jgi:hypothetical protein
VAFALASCLGGAPAGFQVKCLSDRHFRFSVANKRVGFHVYNIRRFIGNHFDAYFHLWRDGAADWEREKRMWEIEQELQWTMVLSKSEKRVAKSIKRVRFAPETFRSPKSNDSPQKSINIGQFSIPIPQNQTQISSLCFGKNRATVHPCSSSILNFKPPAWILQRWSILPQSVATSLVLFLHFLVFQRFVNVAKSWAVQRVSALIFSSRLGFGGQKNC